MGIGDFTAKKVGQGRITNMRTGQSMAFSINPHTVRIKAGANISEDPIPGFSDPLYRFAAGKGKVISFQLDVDGEMTRRKFKSQFLNALHQDRDPFTSYDISSEIEWYLSLTHPSDPSLPNADGGLDRVMLTYGNLLTGVQCFVESVDPTITEWDPDLNPTKAKIDITMKQIADQNIYANMIWDF